MSKALTNHIVTYAADSQVHLVLKKHTSYSNSRVKRQTVVATVTPGDGVTVSIVG